MVRIQAGLLERDERRLDALALVFGDQAGKHLAEMRVLGARMDVLPAVGLEECGADRLQLGLVDRRIISEEFGATAPLGREGMLAGELAKPRQCRLR